MSRNAQNLTAQILRRLLVAGMAALAWWPGRAADFTRPAHAQVVCVENSSAVADFEPNQAVVQGMMDCGLTNFTGQSTVAAAWRSLVSTQDIVGIKVFSEAGMLSGTRPAVVAAAVRGLIAAGVPTNHIIIWDRRAYDLHAAGYFQLAARLGVQAAGAMETGYDPTNFYRPDTAIIGNLVWGDLEFGSTNAGIGRNSFISKLVSRQITKIISIAPLLNQEDVGVTGHLYSLALGSVDNTRRFEDDPYRLATAVPEIYALPLLGDRVVLNVTDALIGQYEGGSRSLLHYSVVLDQLWFSHDPVALDMLSIKELDRERRTLDAAQFKPSLRLYDNANLLQLGQNDLSQIHVEKIK